MLVSIKEISWSGRAGPEGPITFITCLPGTGTSEYLPLMTPPPPTAAALLCLIDQL